jgi:hypothetical protein
MSDDEKKLYDSIVHGLRSQGWSKIEAETEALERVVHARDINGPKRNWKPLSEEEQRARMPISSWQTWGTGEE